jgi:competence protein ComEA
MLAAALRCAALCLLFAGPFAHSQVPAQVPAQAAVTPIIELNAANQAELERVKGVGPALSTLALSARQTTLFQDWNDAIRRLPGMGPARAKKLSDAGLRVNGQAYEPARSQAASAVNATPTAAAR